jgi:hypothetical protein
MAVKSDNTPQGRGGRSLRSLAALTAGIIFLVALAMLLTWLGTLI